MKHCAPGRTPSDIPSCLNKKELFILIRQYNQKFPEQPIQLSGTPGELYRELKRRLGGREDYNMLEHNFMKPVYHKVKAAFRPPKPKSWSRRPNTWLSNFEIDDAMKLYEQEYPGYQFLGTYPVDCPMGYQCPLSRMSIRKLKQKGIHRVGIVFNLDYHYQGGSHWVALFSDFDGPSVEYFDSYGHEPPSMIKQFMKKIAAKLGQSTTLIYNDKRHQYGSSECGMYSMVYIASRLAGKSAYDMSNKRITDREMFQLRDHFFRKISNHYSET